jgi:signal recognition particle subunit SRP54
MFGGMGNPMAADGGRPSAPGWRGYGGSPTKKKKKEKKKKGFGNL